MPAAVCNRSDPEFLGMNSGLGQCVAEAGTVSYAAAVGIMQTLGYQVRKPYAAQVAMQHVAATRAGASAHGLDRAEFSDPLWRG
jgi:hypothetical protein